MKVGFAGTRDETTPAQHKALCGWLKANEVTEFHHGCCIGADDEAVQAVLSLATIGGKIVAHPPLNRSKMSESAIQFSTEVLPAKDYLVRNRDIVDACEVLLACPKGEEEQRSGTWSTVRYARKQGKPVVVLWPDGRIEQGGQSCSS